MARLQSFECKFYRMVHSLPTDIGDTAQYSHCELRYCWRYHHTVNSKTLNQSNESIKKRTQLTLKIIIRGANQQKEINEI
jgi:hypothetical protein